MPTGVLLVAERTITLCGTITPTPGRIADIGPGYGKHGLLLHEYLDPTPHVTAVEAWLPYIEDHRLAGIYDAVWPYDALAVAYWRWKQFDLVVMGDVIEHMPKDEALELLARIPGWIVISTPVDFFHTDEGLPPTERHVSHWTLDDFMSTGRLHHHEISYGAHVVRLSPLAGAR
jgi:2-polyprenyl-3-methyl-5-hydroxy-6-metoxy-1,4-benzoquinol methylase